MKHEYNITPSHKNNEAGTEVEQAFLQLLTHLIFSPECIRHSIADICIFSILQHLP